MIKRLKLPEGVLSDDYIQSEWERLGAPALLKIAAFDNLRISLAPVIETLILLDRVDFLREQNEVGDVRIVALFDPVVSPRFAGILATKRQGCSV